MDGTRAIGVDLGGTKILGFGVPSPTDRRRGVVVQCVHVPLVDEPLRDRTRERYGRPVGLGNDANAAAIGEWRAFVEFEAMDAG